MKPNCQGNRLRCFSRDERGVSFMMVMILILMVGALGVAALTMSAMENSMAGAMRMVEEGTDAAESCVGMGIKVIQQSIDPGAVPAALVAPNGPVPATNALILGQEINYQRNSPDVAWGAGAVPNIVMNVNNYTVNGDIDSQFGKIHAGSGGSGGQTGPPMDYFFRIDCQAVNAATGATSHVIAVYQCLRDPAGDTCTPRFL